MQVGIGSLRHVIIDDQIDSLDINSSGQQISSDDDSLLALLKLVIELNSLSLGQIRVDCEGLKSHVLEDLVQELGSVDLRAEDDNLVEADLLEDRE